MANLKGPERAHYVQDMFARVARRYDLMNRLMTVGQDVRWRNIVIRRAGLKAGDRLLDLGAGTGDLARTALQQEPAIHVVAADFTIEMMRVGISRSVDGGASTQGIAWLGGDATQLPFPDETFDAVISGFLLRNLGDLPGCLSEQYRVLKPGGRVVSLDTAPPPSSPLRPLLEFHMHTIIPALGNLIAGQAEAYRYLPDSTESFLAPEQLAARMAEAGFREVHFERRIFGTIAIHWASKV